jgi:hypothetical protein
VILWEVNLWVYAFRSDSPMHEWARAELDTALIAARRTCLALTSPCGSCDWSPRTRGSAVSQG